MDPSRTQEFDVSIVVVTYEGRDLLPDCIASIEAEAAGSGLSVETIVVDNNSTDGTAQWLRRQYPNILLIASPDNRGFAAGNNLGMAIARGRAYLLMNNDARLQPGALRGMLDALDSEGDVGQVGPQLHNADGSLQRSIRGFPSVWRLATEYLYLRRLGRRTAALNAFYAGGNDHSHRCDAEFLMGACMLVRRAAVDDVGAMDEGYFMFSEETDWAQRFHDAGWRVVFDPSAQVTHLGGATSRKAWNRMFASQVCGHLRYLALHNGRGTTRRAQRLLSFSLGMRAVIYRTAGVALMRKGMVDRARSFSAGRAAVRNFDLTTVSPDIPDLDSLRPQTPVATI
jgi:GT2 family glycosyltransferase